MLGPEMAKAARALGPEGSGFPIDPPPLEGELAQVAVRIYGITRAQLREYRSESRKETAKGVEVTKKVVRVLDMAPVSTLILAAAVSGELGGASPLEVAETVGLIWKAQDDPAITDGLGELPPWLQEREDEDGTDWLEGALEDLGAIVPGARVELDDDEGDD